MPELVIAGQVAPMVGDVPADPRRGRVWMRDDAIVDVTFGERRIGGFAGAAEIDVGDSYVLPGFIDMHNHLAYNALPLWSEPSRTEPWLHNKHWTQADTYTESITEPAWTYAKACPEALLGYVQVREMAGGATAAQGWPSSNRGYQTVMRNVDDERAGHEGKAGDDLIYTSVVTKTGDALATSVRRMEHGAGFIYHCAEGSRGHGSAATSPTCSAPTGCCRPSSASTAARWRGMTGWSGPNRTPAGWSGRPCRTSSCTEAPRSSTMPGPGACASVWARTGDRQEPGTCSAR